MRWFGLGLHLLVAQAVFSFSPPPALPYLNAIYSKCPSIRDIPYKQKAVNEIINHVMFKERGQTYKDLVTFIKTFGPRFVGTKSLEASIDYVVDILRKEGLTNVRTQPVQVPTWRRGRESLTVVRPFKESIPILGGQHSWGTKGRVLEAPVVLIRSVKEVQEITAIEMKGRIVLYSFSDSESLNWYQVAKDLATVISVVQKKGALALVSKPLLLDTSRDIQDLPGPVDFPVACVSVPYANYLTDLVTGADVVVRLHLEGFIGKKAFSRNIIVDIPGHERGVVLMAAHIDTVSISPGAQDNAVGVFLSLRALLVLKRMGLKPRRTIRILITTGEEHGLLGSKAYIETHKDELQDMSIMLNNDQGAFGVKGLIFSGNNSCSQKMVQKVLNLMKPLKATQYYDIDREKVMCNTDCYFFMEKGVPTGLFKNSNNRRIQETLHTRLDDVTTLVPEPLDFGTAFWASLVFVFADIEAQLPPGSSQCPVR